MLAIFDTDALFATLEPKGFLDQSVNCAFQGPDGTPIVAVRDRAGARQQLTRAFGNGGTARYEWDLEDPAGNRLLEVVKPRESLRGASPEVSLTDGTLLGRVAPTRRMMGSPPADLLGPDDSVLGGLVPALGERRARPILMYRIHDADQSQVGEIALQTTGPWGFHVSFGDDADLPVRALTLAWTVCLIQKRTTISAP